MSDLTLKPKFRKLRAKLGLHASWSEIFYVHRKETEHLRQPATHETYKPQDEDGSLIDCSTLTTKRWHSTFDTNLIGNTAIYANPGYDSIADGWDKLSGSDYGTLSKSSASDYGTLSSTSSHGIRYKSSPCQARQNQGSSNSGERTEPGATTSGYASWDSNGMKDSDYSDDSLTAGMGQPDEELNDFSDYFERRKKAVQNWSLNAVEGKSTAVEGKMSHLRSQIASLVAQDDALFKQLLTLRDAISALKIQSPVTGFTTPSSSDSEADESEAGEDMNDHIYSEVDIPSRRRRYLQYSETVRAVRPTIVLSEGQPIRRPQSFPGRPRDKRQPADAQRSARQHLKEIVTSNTKKASNSEFREISEASSHRRQCSFDSGFQGSEPSDAEVFV